MDFRLSEEQDLLRRTVREFAETEIRPHVREWDQAQHFPIELMPKLAALGLLGIQFPEPYGGAGMSALGSRTCIQEGAAARQRKYPGRLARAEKMGAWGLTESASGGDAAGMRTTAARGGNCWVLN